MQDRIGGLYDIGAHEIIYVISDKTGLQSTCVFKIKVNGELLMQELFDVWWCLGKTTELLICKWKRIVLLYILCHSTNTEW